MSSIVAERREPQLGNIKELAQIMKRERGENASVFSRIIFFIGAGCSVSAGVPTVTEIAQDRTIYLAKKYLRKDSSDAAEAYNALVHARQFSFGSSDTAAGTPVGDQTSAEINWGNVYDHIFESHIRSPPEIRDYFGGLCHPEKIRLNWSHLCLGEMVRQRHISTIITTNFDQLVLSGLVQAGILPSVTDGVESLNRVDASLRYPQVIELHGSRHTYALRNARNDVAAVMHDPGAVSTLHALYDNSRLFVVVGYAGREVGVMDLLISAGKFYPDHEVVWVAHSDDPAKLGDKAFSFLATSKHGRLIAGMDSDFFFLELCRELEVGAPRALLEPLATLGDLLENIAAHENPEISTEIERARAMLISLQKAQADYLDKFSETDKLLKKCQEAMLAGDYKKVYELLDPAAVQLDDPDLWQLLGDAAIQLGRDSPDQTFLRRSVEAYKKAARHE